MDREKVIKGVFEMLQRNTWKDIDQERDRFQPVLNDVLELLKEQEAVKAEDAEMFITHNDGTSEYIKDIDSIMLLASKDYDISYCGTFMT